MSERTREPNERTGGTGERPESTSGPRGASATDRGGDQRENERTAREDGRNQRATRHDVRPICYNALYHVTLRYTTLCFTNLAQNCTRLPLHDFPTSVHGLLENTHIIDSLLYMLTLGHSTDLQKQCKIHFDGF